ncbi:hypothetical protein PFISCL1PPCAC_21994, partial [Pristionchus fissidentatus]
REAHSNSFNSENRSMRLHVLVPLLVATVAASKIPGTHNMMCKAKLQGKDSLEAKAPKTQFDVKFRETCVAELFPRIPRALTQTLRFGHVRVKDIYTTFTKINNMIGSGPSKLLTISDFDHTMSRAYDEKGESCWTTHGIFEHTASMADLAVKLAALSAKYKPIEFNSSMTVEQKIPHMEAWWGESNDLIVAKGINRTLLEELVQRSNVRMRDNAPALLKKLEDAHVPLIMFSAGIGDIISVFFSQRLGAVPSNMHIVSNMMVFNNKDVVSGFKPPLIHSFNKNGKVVDKETMSLMSKKENVILMGDSMGDHHMIDGVKNHRGQDALKIGFLNKKDDLLKFYMDKYDIVIVDDQSMDVPRAIIDAVIGVRK